MTELQLRFEIVTSLKLVRVVLAVCIVDDSYSCDLKLQA